MEYLEIQTQERDRWDAIAWRMYGDPYAYEGLLRANPTVSPMPELVGGITLRIPILELKFEQPVFAPWQN